MPFFRFDALPPEYVTPKYSKAFGPLVAGGQIELGRLRATVDGTTDELGPGEGFLVSPNAPHQVTAVEDTEVLSYKGLVDGRGHRI